MEVPARRKIGIFLVATGLIGGLVLYGTEAYLERLLAAGVGDLGPSQKGVLLAIVAGLIVAGSVAMYPIAAPIVLAAALVGLPAVFVTYPAAIIGSTVGWWLGREFGERTTRRFSVEAVEKIADIVARRAILAAFVIRLIPGLPFALQNAGIGAAGGRLVPFVLGTMGGVAISHVVLYSIGLAAANVMTNIGGSVRTGWFLIAAICVAGIVLCLIPQSASNPTPSDPGDSP